MKKFSTILLALGILGSLNALTSEASTLRCRNSMQRLTAKHELFQAIDEAAALHAHYGDLGVKKSGAVFNAHLLQGCTNKARDFEGFAAHFKVRAKKGRGAAVTFTCLTKQKRRIDYTGKWSGWYNVVTRCTDTATIASRRAPRSPGYEDDDRGHLDHAPGPDELYDPDFYDRRPSYDGPDSVDDGSGHTDDDGHRDSGGSNPDNPDGDGGVLF